MDVHLYAALISLIGLALAYFLGRAMSEVNGVAAILVFAVISVVLGLVLTFGCAALILRACSIFGIAEKACISTSHQTVWYYLTPLVVCPVYIVLMFVGRAVDRGKQAVAETAEMIRRRDLAKGDPTALGLCPNCRAELRLQASECNRCGAQFGEGAAWFVEPLHKGDAA